MGTERASSDTAVTEVLALPVDQRIALVQDLWDSVAIDPTSVPVASWQLEEVRSRKAKADADPSSLLSDEEFWRQVDGE